MTVNKRFMNTSLAAKSTRFHLCASRRRILPGRNADRSADAGGHSAEPAPHITAK
jgi:hypothetical protein